MPPVTVTNAIVFPTVYGQVIVNRHDLNQTLHLLQTGAAIDYPEIDIVSQLVEPGMVAVDVGACFGLWTLAFAKNAAAVYTFEAQRLLYNCICGSLALNSIENVFVYNAAIGATNGTIDVPRYDYHGQLQFGCVHLCPRKDHGEMLQEPKGSESVPLIALDVLGLPQIDVMKVDVEGMELDVLKGAKQLIEKSRPALYVEIILTDRQAVVDFLEPMGYVFTGNTDNLLALPKEKYTLTPREDGKTLITKVTA